MFGEREFSLREKEDANVECKKENSILIDLKYRYQYELIFKF